MPPWARMALHVGQKAAPVFRAARRWLSVMWGRASIGSKRPSFFTERSLTPSTSTAAPGKQRRTKSTIFSICCE